MTNATNQAQAIIFKATTAVPRYVSALCDIAWRAGIEVRPPRVEPYIVFKDEEPEARLVADWIGTSQAFYQTGLFVPSQRKILEFPTKEALLSAPSSLPYNYLMLSTTIPLMVGFVSGTCARQHWIVDFGPPPSVSKRGAVEVISTAAHVSLHGTAEALVADGIPLAHLPTGKRAVRTGAYEDWQGGQRTALKWWGCRRQPDGTFLHREDSDATFAARVQECSEFRQRMSDAYGPPPVQAASVVKKSPSHLRLVVDNT